MCVHGVLVASLAYMLGPALSCSRSSSAGSRGPFTANIRGHWCNSCGKSDDVLFISWDIQILTVRTGSVEQKGFSWPEEGGLLVKPLFKEKHWLSEGQNPRYKLTLFFQFSSTCLALLLSFTSQIHTEFVRLHGVIKQLRLFYLLCEE